jgi:CRISPR/Cas system CSM-associated protein Csm2 small subunit
MSTNETIQVEAAIEVDMRKILRAKKATSADNRAETDTDYGYLINQISGQSVAEIDHLIRGLQGVRERLGSDGDRLRREFAEFASFNQSIVQFTKVISDGMAFVSKATTPALVESPKVSPEE